VLDHSEEEDVTIPFQGQKRKAENTVEILEGKRGGIKRQRFVSQTNAELKKLTKRQYTSSDSESDGSSSSYEDMPQSQKKTQKKGPLKKNLEEESKKEEGRER
jgi:hypothetical protein